MKTNIIFIEEIYKAINSKKLKINDIEQHILDSIFIQMSKNPNLSKKQREFIDKIHDKIPAW